MCMECEKNIFVKCVKSVHVGDSEVLTQGKVYGAFSWYSEVEDCYNLAVMDNEQGEHTISDGVNDDIDEFSEDEWFIEHFEFVSNGGE